MGRHNDEINMDAGMEVVVMQEGEGGWCEVRATKSNLQVCHKTKMVGFISKLSRANTT